MFSKSLIVKSIFANKKSFPSNLFFGKFIFLLTFLGFFPTVVFTQNNSVKILNKNGIPVISGIKNKNILSKIQTKIGESKIQCEVSNSAGNTDKVLVNEYKVDHNKDGILSLSFRCKTITGEYYGDDITKSIAFNLKNGEQIKASDIFADMKKLSQKVDVVLRKKVEPIQKTFLDLAIQMEDPKEEQEKYKYKPFVLDNSSIYFSIQEKGISFFYDYCCVRMELTNYYEGHRIPSPMEQVFFTYDEISLFIKKDGLLSKQLK